VLTLIVFASFQPGHPTPIGINADAHFEQQPTVVPAEHLRAEDHGRGMVVGGIEQAFQASWIGGAVIVQQPHPRDHIGRQRGLDRGHGGQPGIHCSAETIISTAKDYALFAQ